jgi:transcriptional antiterminator NusG
MADALEKQWYVVKAVGGKEKKVRDQIILDVQRNFLSDYVYQFIVPTEKVYHMKNGKRITKERNFFPGYIIIEAALVGEVPHVIKSVESVTGFLGTEKGGEPAALRPKEIQRILGTVDDLSEAVEQKTEQVFVVGETVKVTTEGLFHGFLGVVDEVDLDRQKLTLMVKFFGRKVPMQLSFSQVERQA